MIVIITKKMNWLDRLVMLFRITIEKSVIPTEILSKLFLSELSRNYRTESVKGRLITISSVILLISLS